tara:strand:+ start:66 stop:233 length:168 start_codon:yes stop_codon:yes gene_type:complete
MCGDECECKGCTPEQCECKHEKSGKLEITERPEKKGNGLLPTYRVEEEDGWRFYW